MPKFNSSLVPRPFSRSTKQLRLDGVFLYTLDQRSRMSAKTRKPRLAHATPSRKELECSYENQDHHRRSIHDR